MLRNTLTFALLLLAGLHATACTVRGDASDSPKVAYSSDSTVDSSASTDGELGSDDVGQSDVDGVGEPAYPGPGYPPPPIMPEVLGPPLPGDDSAATGDLAYPAYPGATTTPNPGSRQWPGNASWLAATPTPGLTTGWVYDIVPTPTVPEPTPTSGWVLASDVTTTPRPSPTEPATPTPDPFMLAGPPIRLQVPSIGVDAIVESVGLTSDRSMAAPKGWQNVAWFLHGFRPGEVGNAVIAGHLDTNTGGPAVFWDLNQVRPGDELFVTYENGDRYAFLVDGSELYDHDAQGATIERIFGSSQTADLNLVTCDGAWDHGRATYSKRLVVFSSLLPEKTVLVSQPGAFD
jgi:hypothetical protein